MTLWTMIFGIATVSIIAGVVNNYFKHRPAPGDRAAREEDKRRIKDLEKRVQVLEEIVTDGNYDLKRQFEDLENTG